MSKARLFSYGTLQRPEVQQALFGRLLDGAPAVLTGFSAGTIQLDDSPATELGGGGTYPILRRSHDPADRIEGMVYALSEADLHAADAYETDAYARILVSLEDGSTAFVYAHAEEWLDDLRVGEIRRFGRYEVDRDEVLAFARAYDPQPFHLSDEAAARTHFGRLAASGWHTCSMAMAMTVEEIDRTGFQSLGAGGIDELRWHKPVYPGDVLSMETEVLEVTPFALAPRYGQLSPAQRGAEPAWGARLLLYRGTDGAAAAGLSRARPRYTRRLSQAPAAPPNLGMPATWHPASIRSSPFPRPSRCAPNNARRSTAMQQARSSSSRAAPRRRGGSDAAAPRRRSSARSGHDPVHGCSKPARRRQCASPSRSSAARASCRTSQQSRRARSQADRLRRRPRPPRAVAGIPPAQAARPEA